MRVILTEQAFTPSVHGELLQILAHSLKGRHDVLVHPTARPAWDAWLETQPQPQRSIYRRSE